MQFYFEFAKISIVSRGKSRWEKIIDFTYSFGLSFAPKNSPLYVCVNTRYMQNPTIPHVFEKSLLITADERLPRDQHPSYIHARFNHRSETRKVSWPSCESEHWTGMNANGARLLPLCLNVHLDELVSPHVTENN